MNLKYSEIYIDFSETTTVYSEGMLYLYAEIENILNIRKDITKISYATFMIELAEQVMRQNKNAFMKLFSLFYFDLWD